MLHKTQGFSYGTQISQVGFVVSRSPAQERTSALSPLATPPRTVEEVMTTGPVRRRTGVHSAAVRVGTLACRAPPCSLKERHAPPALMRQNEGMFGRTTL